MHRGCKRRADLAATDLLALHGSLPLQEQQRALKHSPDGQRNIIFSTNIAETSLTIPGVTGVVDSGLERALNFDPVQACRVWSRKISRQQSNEKDVPAVCNKASAFGCGEKVIIRLWRNIILQKF